VEGENFGMPRLGVGLDTENRNMTVISHEVKGMNVVLLGD